MLFIEFVTLIADLMIASFVELRGGSLE